MRPFRIVATSILVASLAASAAVGDVGPAEGLELVFEDGFESGDITRWSREVQRARRDDTPLLEVNVEAALEGLFGLESGFEAGEGPTYVEKRRIGRNDVLFNCFSLQVNRLLGDKDERVTVLQLLRRKKPVAELFLSPKNRRRVILGMTVYDNNGTPHDGPRRTLKVGRIYSVAYTWARASGLATGDGGATLNVNDRFVGQKLVDNDQLAADRIRLGRANTANLNGSIYLDEFESFRTLAPQRR